MPLPADNRVPVVITSSDHDALMKAIENYELLASYGQMDPDVEKWLTVIVLMPRQSIEIKARALREDYGFEVDLCRSIEDAKVIVEQLPSWQ
jgi:hypothetical protein